MANGIGFFDRFKKEKPIDSLQEQLAANLLRRLAEFWIRMQALSEQGRLNMPDHQDEMRALTHEIFVVFRNDAQFTNFVNELRQNVNNQPQQQ